MRDPLVVAVAQPSCTPLDVAANASEHAISVRSANARVVLFPELSLTGYELDAPEVAPDDARLAPIVAACAQTGSLALIGAPVRGRGHLSHIAMLAVDGNGVRVAYRKLWLSAQESGRFSPGPGPVVIEVDRWRLGLAICKDTGMPAHTRATASLGIDAYLGATVMSAAEKVIQDARADRIAKAHNVWVAMASFAGPTGSGYDVTAGCSGIWSPDGRVCTQAGPEVGGVASATLY